MRHPILALGLVSAFVVPLGALADSPMGEPASSGSDGVLTSAPSTPPSWALRPVPRAGQQREDAPIWVQARRHNSPVFAARSPEHGRGLVRGGTILRATPLARNEHCSGRWYKLEPRGYVCTGYGFRASSSPLEAPAALVPPNLGAPLPYRYAQVNDRSAFRFERLPSARELEKLADGDTLPGLAEKLDGDYFVAVAEEVDHEGQRFVRTVDGKYVPQAAIEDAPGSRLSGVHDPEGLDLPIAFIYREDTRVVDGRGRAATANKYDRFEVVSIHDDHLVSKGGVRVPADAVRLVERAERPDDVPADGKWIHVNLDQQTIVAYEGDTPVFASLVATGKEGYDTPAGLYRVRHKYASITMHGDDPHEGVYDVAEVPWTMYYRGSYALHGAYWHDAFGDVRSHGCTNIAPADARFLFTWSTPRLPDGWHGVRRTGTWVHLTRASDA